MAKQKVSLSDKQQMAHELFMRSNQTQKEIAKLVGVAPETVGDWVKKGRWKELKTANSVTRSQIIANKLMQIQEMHELFAKRDKKYPDYKEQLVLSLIADDIRKLDKSLSLPDYITAIQEFIRSVNDKSPAAAKQVAAYVMEFIQSKARQIAA